MSATLHFHGHATFSLVLSGGTVVIDPFLTGNPAASTTVEELTADLICISHAHDDHVVDVPALAAQTGAPLVANYEIASHYTRQGIENCVGVNPGGSYDAGFCRVKWTVAVHSSSFSDGTYGGEANGILVSTDSLRLFYAGDTALFSDMQLIGAGGLDLAILPIGDHFTMGIDDSIQAVRFLGARQVVPMHYNTFPPIEQDVDAWARRVSTETDSQPVILQPGESHDLP